MIKHTASYLTIISFAMYAVNEKQKILYTYITLWLFTIIYGINEKFILCANANLEFIFVRFYAFLCTCVPHLSPDPR